MTPTPKPVDFPGSTRRHLNDAMLLEGSRRLHNAGHLYGYAAECGLKAILVSHGYPVDADGSPQRGQFRAHVDQLALSSTMSAMKTFLTGRSGAHYLALIPHIDDFSDWNASHRYYSEAAVPASLDKWREAAAEVGRMLDQARTSGLL